VPPQTSLARKRFRQLLLSVAVVHVVAIAAYYVLGVPSAPTRFQRVYAWTWMGATVAVVVIGLQRLKRARARNVIRRPGASDPDPDSL
jgi:hypothetical protein